MKRKDILPQLYQLVAEEAMFGIVVFTTDGECLFINRMATQLFGTSEVKLNDLILEDNRSQLKGFSMEVLKNDGLYQDILVRKMGGSFIANIGVRLIEIDSISAYALMLQDVTLQKKLQREIIAKQTEIKSAFEELLKQNQALRELDVAKDRFVALTTHELRTPLAAMLASAEILKLELFDTPEQLKEFVGLIYEQGLHLQELVNDILDFAKIQAGKMEFYIEEDDIFPLIQSIAKQFENMAESNSVSIKVETPDHPLNCYYDEIRIRQVLANIVNNAIKYNRRPGTVTISFEETTEMIKVSITDTGPGIPAELFGKVFNEFETLGQVNTHHKGTGLGMPISRKLTEGMGGKLGLASQVGIGSTFSVELPKNRILDPSVYRSRPEQFDIVA